MIDLNNATNVDDLFNQMKGRADRADLALLLGYHNSLRAMKTSIQTLESRRNELSKEIGAGLKSGADVSELRNMTRTNKESLDSGYRALEIMQNKLDAVWGRVPNIPCDDVPTGGEESNQVLMQQEIKEIDFTVQEHHLHPGFDFGSAAAMSGSRFAVITSPIAKLHRVLGQFMIDMHTEEHGFHEVDVPLLVKGGALRGTGQLPKFEEDLFKTNDGYYLIPTGEVPITNIVSDTIVDYNELPIRMVGLTPCFRSEAGSAGRDTHGLIRQHQFNKVELVTIASPDRSDEEHMHMLQSAENVLNKLDLRFRRVLLASNDMGFSAQKTYDLEVWLPGQKAWREISSVSNCGAFQARRMATRTKLPGDKKTTLVHTLNGSGLAVGRTLVAVMENYQNADGSITIPEALLKYFNGKTVL